MGWNQVISWGLLALLGAFGVWFFFDKDALRDVSAAKPKPYSLARVQLWWWTLIILGCTLALYAAENAFPEINSACLALLGIGGGTALTTRLVDDNALRAVRSRHQDQPNEGFFRDILSDENGLSVARLQHVMFHLAYGCLFVVMTCDTGDLPKFSTEILTLLGVSAGTYVALKGFEK